MPTYVYETIPEKPGSAPAQFEIRQSMKDAPLKKHPETGEPVRRVISGGLGIIKGAMPPTPTQHSCGSGCGCR